MKIVIISSSIDKKSRGLIMADYAKSFLNGQKVDNELIDLNKYTLPFCDGGDSYNDPAVKEIKSKLKSGDGIIVATPVYNYNVNSVLKNVIELTGSSWIDKPVGFLCSAGGFNSYMSIMSIANSLMLDFRCIIIPRFVYAVNSAFDEEKRTVKDEKIRLRIDQLCEKLQKIATALKN